MSQPAQLEFGVWDHFEQQDPEVVPLQQQYEDRIQYVVEAERLGFGRYHVAEHHLTPLDMAPSPTVFLGAVARHTSRNRLGSMVLCLPLCHPVRLIQEICMLDHLSGGRLEPGVGRGVRDVEHDWFGLDPMQSRERYKETLDVLVQGLLYGKLDYSGHFFSHTDVPLHHRSLQKPLPPFWYAGNVLSAAAQGINGLGGAQGEEGYAAYWRTREEGRASGNRMYRRDPLLGSIRHPVVAPTDAEARAIARRAWRIYGDHFFATDLQVLGERHIMRATGPGADPDKQMDSGALLAGSPSTIRDKLLATVERNGPGHNYMAGAFQWGDMTHVEAVQSLRLFATEMMPALVESRIANSTAAR
jgi:alkanesulfonate monooxygenase SsuD/methylene tetrahydromethanopterin reductase-like flavin-dependent oxidoreductase (luciferase family)